VSRLIQMIISVSCRKPIQKIPT